MTDFYTTGYARDFIEGPGLAVAPIGASIEDLNEMCAQNAESLENIDDAAFKDTGEGLLVYRLVPYAHVFGARVTLENALDGDGIAVRELQGQTGLLDDGGPSTAPDPDETSER